MTEQDQPTLSISATPGIRSALCQSSEPLPPALQDFLVRNGLPLDLYSNATASDSSKRYLRIMHASSVNSDVDAAIRQFESEIHSVDSSVLIEPVLGVSYMYAMPSHVGIRNTSSFTSGRLLGVDLASAIAALALDVQAGDNVLDLCCSPGGKLCMIADMLNAMGGNGTVTGVDISKSRLETCRALVKKYKPLPARLFLADGTRFDAGVPPPNWKIPYRTKTPHPSEQKHEKECTAKLFYAPQVLRNPPPLHSDGQCYDRVLVDAECTHDGSIAHMVKALSRPDAVDHCASLFSKDKQLQTEALQRRLLDHGWKMLKEGGVLVYSTCSLTRGQNEDIIASFMKDNSEQVRLETVSIPEHLAESAKLATIPKPLESNVTVDEVLFEEIITKTIRFDPRTSPTSGLFIAKLHKLPFSNNSNNNN
ncbi:S-adenosyl-L-methionine-dependent methyltransferase [Ramicandelaber brevisporus]|nr:S-adenosyl-L-methionine-dependent methyltransferase [Ramicandelaber brevisporus]